jgi:hypothetical protein
MPVFVHKPPFCHTHLKSFIIKIPNNYAILRGISKTQLEPAEGFEPLTVARGILLPLTPKVLYVIVFSI